MKSTNNPLISVLLIGILNSDDFFEIDTIEKVVDIYIQNLGHQIFYGILKYINQNDLCCIS
jgi:hypothetical protein